MATWKGWIIEESLNDTTVLSKLNVISSMTERNEEGDAARVWHLNTVEIDSQDIGNIAAELQQNIKRGWYCHFTDYKNLIVVFHGKFFRIRLEKVVKEKETGAVEFKADKKELRIWKDALEYGTKKAKVDKRYIIKVF